MCPPDGAVALLSAGGPAEPDQELAWEIPCIQYILDHNHNPIGMNSRSQAFGVKNISTSRFTRILAHRKLIKHNVLVFLATVMVTQSRYVFI